MEGVKNFKYYKCGICKGKKARYWKKFSKWVDKHFKKYHPNQQIKLERKFEK